MKRLQRKIGRTDEKGAALLTVLVALMIVTILLFEFQYAAMVERKLAYNDLNQTQAYYLAKSGARIGALRVALYARMKNDPGLKSLAGNNAAMLNSILDQIWQMNLPPFPPADGSLKQLFKADQDAAEKVLAETKMADGQYSVNIRSESSKLNLNSLVIPTAQANQRPNFTVAPSTPYMFTGLMLVNLLNGFLKESENPYEEYPDLRPEELVSDIMDWVTPGDNRVMGGSKDAFYTSLTPAYKAKKGRFFTTEELRLVKGIDGRIFEKLKPYVTVYSYDSKLNINAAGETLYRAIYHDFTDDDLKRIMEQRTKLGGWGNEKQFVDFVVQTLGRSGFQTTYPDPKNYPFTIGTESFLIEALGEVRKSASTIQRRITLAVAFTTARGGTKIDGMTQAECVKSPTTRFWDAFRGGCLTNPVTESDCTSNLAGQISQQGPKTMCTIQISEQQGSMPKTFELNAKPAAGAPGATPAKASGGNTMKILYWAES